MSRILYFECYSGISGDMAVAALLDLGIGREALDAALASISHLGFKTELKRVEKSGISALDFNVILDEDNHDHDPDYLYGSNPAIRISSHAHRNLEDIINIISSADMSDNAKRIAVDIFTVIARAEAEAHNLPIDKVHFHEVGAVDSIVDVVCAAVCADSLGADKIISSELYEGCGTVNCMHGTLPVPVPAVVNIAREHALSLKITDIKGELVTPTGAAIIAALKSNDTLPESFVVKKTGLGAGKRAGHGTGILRAMLIEDNTEKESSIVKLECNVDDCSGEALGYTMELLMEGGARDVNFIPCYMKKNRPAYQLNVLCRAEEVKSFADIIFRETTTIGIRIINAERMILERSIIRVQTEYGEASVKKCTGSDSVYYYPEYESVKVLAKKNKVPFTEIYKSVQNICLEAER